MKYQKKHSAYLKMWSSFSILIFVLMLLICAICYYCFNRSFTTEVEKNQLSIIEYENNIISMLVVDRANTLAKELVANSNYADIFKMPITSKENHNVAIWRAYDKLNAFYELNSDILEQVILFYPEERFCISTNGGYKILSHASNSEYKRLLATILSSPQATWYSDTNQFSITNSDIGFSISPLWAYSSSDCQLQMMFFVRKEFILQVMKEMVVGNQSLYLLDQQGNILCNTGTETPYSIAEKGINALMSQNGQKLYTFTDNKENSVFTVCALAETPFYLAISTPITAWRGKTTTILSSMVISGISVILLGVYLVTRISKKLYAPLQILSELVREIPSISIHAAKDEYVTIQSAIDELSSLLSNTRRILNSNKSLLKNQAFIDLMCGNEPYEALETLRSVHIQFPNSHYQFVAVEYCSGDTHHLDAADRRIISIALPELVETRFEQEKDKVYGFILKTNTICFIVNSEQNESESIDVLLEQIASFFDYYHLRYYVVKYSNSQIPCDFQAAHSALMTLLNGRMFDLREEAFHTTITTGNNALEIKKLLDQLKALPVSCPSNSILSTMEQLVAVLSQTSPALASVYWKQSIAYLRQLLFMRYPEREITVTALSLESEFWKIDEVVPWIEKNIAETIDLIPTNEEFFMQNVKKYIDDHIAEDIVIEDIAEAFHYNTKYFSRKFKELSGITLLSYISIQRMELATHLMKSNELTIDQIAEKVGYRSTQYFIRKFKEYYGTTPGEYRKLCIDNAKGS